VKQFWLFDFGFSIEGSRNKIAFGLALAASLFALCLSAEAQQQAKIPKIGWLGIRTAASDPARESIRREFRALGYVEGKNIVFEYRSADDKIERLSALADELVHLKVDVLLAWLTPAAIAAKNATGTIPIVFSGGFDPVAAGLVDSLARPGGNITGFSGIAPVLAGKRLELLKEIFPKVSKVAMFWNKSNAGMAVEARATQEAAGPLGVTLQDRGVKDAGEIEAVFDAMNKERPDAFLALMDVTLLSHRNRILAFLERNRVPAIYESKDWVEAGGLISYGANSSDVTRRAAVQMDKILKGVKPADIPVEQPTKFEMVINLNTAKQIGLTIPPNVLARADRVIR